MTHLAPFKKLPRFYLTLTQALLIQLLNILKIYAILSKRMSYTNTAKPNFFILVIVFI